jgi:signal transduction histidine kinase
VANELAGTYYLSKGRPLFANHYLTSAWGAWKRWGAIAKCRDIESRYEELFHSGQQGSSHTLATMHMGHETTDESISRKGRQLDLESLMKATRAISGELTLRALLGKLLSIIMENMGARRVLLLLNEDNHWFIEGQVEITAGENKPIQQLDLHEPLGTSNKLPISMVQAVTQSQTTILLRDASTDNPRFQDDNWFMQNSNVKSVLCTHLRSQNKLVGLLYMENDLVAGAFNKQRLKLLEMLTVQAAISIENASLYYDLEKKVRERTQELRAAQAELVKHAREAGMAEIAQGVMHNIGNALTPLKTSAQITHRLIQKSTLRHHLKDALDSVTGIIDESDHADKKRLGQIVHLLPQGIEDEYQKMELELKRINQRIEHIESIIYLQVKYTHAKSFKEMLDINSVVKDALEMMEDNLMKYRVLLHTEFGELPGYKGEKHQLLQIFINLIKNAKEAMESMPLDKRQLWVSTSLQESEETSKILIQIRDSGEGFDATKKEQLFNYGYTTKATGTGVGLHASANYIISQGGLVEAESDGPGRGSTFTVILPLE